MRSRRFLVRLGRDTRASAMLEFGLLAPAIVVMIIGVFQVGIALQAYNAMRNVSADTARHAMIKYAAGTKLTDVEMQTYATNTAVAAPYFLKSASVSATVATAATQRFTGVTEKTLTVSYTIVSLIDGLGLKGPALTYQRPLFLCTTC